MTRPTRDLLSIFFSDIVWLGHYLRQTRLTARAEVEAKVARVEALADEWDAHGRPVAAAELRAALAGDDT